MNKTYKLFVPAVLLLLALHNNSACQDSWISLFDGETLKGWSVHSGHASYRVNDGTIVGQAVPDSPNSFLCTEEEFGDFILEFEVLLEDDELNSGVQFRSHIAPRELVFWFRNDQGNYQPTTIPADRVYGYQVEIAVGGGSGGVYDEARRAMTPWWPQADSEESKVFKSKQWNSYRIECKGDSIRTIVNGVVITEFRDGLSDRGIIGLQVHDVGDNPSPYQVRWRNIRLMPL
ncbi:MAG: DUF1080 domain-containing protein [Bacteroidales bacterium]|nr:DUF1080 domain-containing protein [Bacteroidales bacterium]